MVEWLSAGSGFPPVEESTPEGIVAIGGDLSVERLLSAYCQGIFPWYGPEQPILWWSPDPRAVIPLDSFRVNRSLRKQMRRGTFEISCNSAFEEVINACAVRSDGSPSGWITDEMIEGFMGLHRRGHAHSVEVWRGDKLAGGLYGVSLGGFFAGESMFHREDDAGKLALVALVERLRENGFQLLDCQMVTPLTASFGAVEIPRRQYLMLLRNALQKNCSFRENENAGCL